MMNRNHFVRRVFQASERTASLNAGWLLCTLLVTLCLMVVPGGMVAEAAPLRVSIASNSVQRDSSYTFMVVVGTDTEPIADLYGLGFGLAFDAGAFEVLGAEASSFLDPSDSPVLEFRDINNSSGLLAFSASLISGAGVSGEGAFAEIALRVKSDAPPGFHRFALVDVDAIDSTGNAIPLEVVSDSVWVSRYHWTAEREDTELGPGVSIKSNGLLTIAPSPFREATTIAFQLFALEPVTIEVYSVSGRLVNRLLGGREAQPGRYGVKWYGDSQDGQKVAPGIYLIRVAAGESVETRKVILSD